VASAMNRRRSFLARYEGLGVIPIAMIGIGMVSIAGLSVLPLGDEWGFLASVLTVALIGGGVFLLFVYLTGYGAIWLSRKLATTTRLIAVEPEPPPPTEPIGRCPAWRVTLSDGPHTVYLEDDRASPKRLVCDGRWVDLVWPDHLGRAEAVFTVSGRRAVLSEAIKWWKLLVTLPLVLSTVSPRVEARHYLHVDGASVERLRVGPPVLSA
jgi:hypothetical protein